ncbi:MAG: BolA/IbaG family iron-sulfur metabolism protein [Deltaproteobacteria bacterium]|nr:MAG: BolA/IbaG family iron-sulfur metabolism protein [Deltaproteobacteria bacterium]
MTAADPVSEQLAEAIRAALPDAVVEVRPQSPGHYALRVVSAAFEGKGLLDKQRLVYAAIAPLMKGDAAPVHAIDHLETQVP